MKALVKKKSGKTRRGNTYLTSILYECSWASRKTDTFLGNTFRRLQARLGGKKAAVAVGHKTLVIIFHLLSEGTFYDEGRYKRHYEQKEAKQVARAKKKLQRLGYEVVEAKEAA